MSRASSDAGPSSLSPAPFAPNERYLHGKTRHPLTVRHVGLLPGASDGQTWIGVEYDDPTHGKGHTGVYKNIQVFQTLQPGAGAFIKYTGKTTPLVAGTSLVDVLEERYGPLGDETAPAQPHTQLQPALTDESVILGSSNAAIVVEAPNMDGVRRRIGRLERLREIGFDGEWVGSLGGTEAKRLLFKERLKGVRTLDLSNNLVKSWEDAAEICQHLPGLSTLVMNHSRIQTDGLSVKDSDRYRLAFAGIKELHLGDAAYTWPQAVELARLFPSLEVFNLNHNTLLSDLECPLSAESLPNVKTLNLDGCPLKDWADIATGLRDLPALESLNLAATPINSIPECTASPLSNLKQLSLTGTVIARWRDIDHLSDWTQGKLEHLRISCAGDKDEDKTLHASLNTQLMTGNARTDRSFLIAKLPALTMLNGTTITSAERWDAEVYYIHFINNLGLSHPAGTWGRFEELVQLHGPAVKTAPKQTTLKSKLINLHVIPPSGLTFTLRILPSAPVTLLEKKVAKHIKVPSARVWTARKHDSIVAAWEPVEEMEDGREVGLYVSEGDYVVVVV